MSLPKNCPKELCRRKSRKRSSRDQIRLSIFLSTSNTDNFLSQVLQRKKRNNSIHVYWFYSMQPKFVLPRWVHACSLKKLRVTHLRLVFWREVGVVCVRMLGKESDWREKPNVQVQAHKSYPPPPHTQNNPGSVTHHLWTPQNITTHAPPMQGPACPSTQKIKPQLKNSHW